MPSNEHKEDDMFTRRMKTVAALLAASALVASGAALAAGVSDGEIVLGTHLDLSGPTAAARTRADIMPGICHSDLP